MNNHNAFIENGVTTPIQDGAFKNLKYTYQVIKHTQYPSIVSVSGICDVRIRQFQAFDQRKHSNHVESHSQWIPLPPSLPTMYNIGRPIPYSQYGREMRMIADF